MNQLLQMQSEDGKELLVYHYKKIQDVDEVILQLLNEAGLDGFIKSTVNKADATINYDITGYRQWKDIAKEGIPAEYMASALEDLYRLLAYLEDSFIDIEYVLLDADYLFVHPETNKIRLIVVPCQTIVNEGYTLAECVKKMFAGMTSDQSGEKTVQVENKVQQGVNSLRELKELVDLLHSYHDEAEDDTETLDMPVKAEAEKNQEKPFTQNVRTDETSILEEIVKDAEKEKEKNDRADLQSDAAYMRQQLREDMRQSMEAELTEKIKKDIRSEVENELREKIWAELSETFNQNMRQDIENELREKIRAELEEEYAEKAKALEAQKSEEEENEEEANQEENEKASYLIRKKTGEIIQLDKQTFIIGKLDTCCDYVIRGNNAISRLHAVIKYREDSDSYFIVDCNSTNHTYLNGRRIESEQPAELKDGMHIHLALEEFIFQLT